VNTPLRVWLTGAAGMVGRNLAEHPAVGGWRLIAPTRGELDLEDAAAVRAFVRATRPQVVIHAAGLVGGIQANIARPVDFLVRNTDIGRNVVLAAHAAGVQQLVNLGSSCMYPHDVDYELQGPLREPQLGSGALEPTNEGYALAKLHTLRLVQYLRRQEPTLQYATLVPCNLYGRHDHYEPGRSHLVAAALAKVVDAQRRGQHRVTVWGDGSARREFMDAADLADAVVRFVHQGAGAPEIMNIGTGRDHSVDEIHLAAARALGWPVTLEHDVTRPVGMKRKLLDVSAQTAWGWAPRIGLEQGMRRALEQITEPQPA
jgi:GDP-L-fucose synthase